LKPDLNPVEKVWACCNARNFFANDPNAITSIIQRSLAPVNQ